MENLLEIVLILMVLFVVPCGLGIAVQLLSFKFYIAPYLGFVFGVIMNIAGVAFERFYASVVFLSPYRLWHEFLMCTGMFMLGTCAAILLAKWFPKDDGDWDDGKEPDPDPPPDPHNKSPIDEILRDIRNKPLLKKEPALR